MNPYLLFCSILLVIQGLTLTFEDIEPSLRAIWYAHGLLSVNIIVKTTCIKVKVLYFLVVQWVKIISIVTIVLANKMTFQDDRPQWLTYAE